MSLEVFSEEWIRSWADELRSSDAYRDAAATWEGSLRCLSPLGLMVSFGNASGAVPPIRPVELAAHGSLFLTRPTLMTYTAERKALLAAARELFNVLESGSVRVAVRQRYQLSEARKAHQDLEARRTAGSSVLLP